MKHTLITAFRKSLPVMAGYIVLGIGFGILLKEAGYGFFWSFLMSLTIYAGSMQYVAVSLLTAGASLITVALTTLMVNARHLFYGLSMIGKYKDAGRDDIPEGVNRNRYRLFVSLFNQSYWVLGSVLGSLLGAVIPFDTAGIDFSMTALFVTVFVEQWLTAKNRWPAVIGLAASVACLVIFGAEHFLIPTMITVTLALLLLKKTGGEGHE